MNKLQLQFVQTDSISKRLSEYCSNNSGKSFGFDFFKAL